MIDITNVLFLEVVSGLYRSDFGVITSTWRSYGCQVAQVDDYTTHLAGLVFHSYCSLRAGSDLLTRRARVLAFCCRRAFKAPGSALLGL